MCLSCVVFPKLVISDRARKNTIILPGPFIPKGRKYCIALDVLISD